MILLKSITKKEAAVEAKGLGDTIENHPPLLGACRDKSIQYLL